MAPMVEEHAGSDVTQHIESPEELENVNNARLDSLLSKTPKRKWVSYIWDTLDKSPEERKLVFKLDCALLTFASLSRGITTALFKHGLLTIS